MIVGCLALNASFEPLTMVPMRRALRLVIDGKAEIVEADTVADALIEMIVRTANATGTATLTVIANTVTMKQLEIGTWVQVAYTGTAWIVVGAGAL